MHSENIWVLGLLQLVFDLMAFQYVSIERLRAACCDPVEPMCGGPGKGMKGEFSPKVRSKDNYSKGIHNPSKVGDGIHRQVCFEQTNLGDSSVAGGCYQRVCLPLILHGIVCP